MSSYIRKSHAELHPKKKKKIAPLPSVTVIESNIQFCLGCHHPIQKIGGCNYVKCKLCKTSFCWICHKIKGIRDGECNEKEHNSH